MHRRVAKVDYDGNPVLLEIREDPTSSHCKNEDIFHLLRYQGMSKGKFGSMDRQPPLSRVTFIIYFGALILREGSSTRRIL